MNGLRPNKGLWVGLFQEAKGQVDDDDTTEMKMLRTSSLD